MANVVEYKMLPLNIKREINNKQWILSRFAERFNIYQHADKWDIVYSFFKMISIINVENYDLEQFDTLEEACREIWNDVEEWEVPIYINEMNKEYGWVEDIDAREAHWEEVNEARLRREFCKEIY